MMNNLVRIEEVAEMTGLSVATIYRYVADGRIPVVRLSSQAIRFDPDQLREWIAQKTQAAS